MQSNILISDDGRALIAGFSLSSVAASGHALDDVVGGTLNWTAPELHEDGHPSSTLESDIWSLSCLFYEVTPLFDPVHPQCLTTTIADFGKQGAIRPISYL